MELKQLQSFVTVIQLNSFTRAAEVLYISQPTISTHIRQLEEELHTRLLIRSTKSIEITAKGRDFYDYAVQVLDLTDRMIKNCSVQEQKIIHLGASTIPSAHIIPEVLPKFGLLNPETYFVIHQSDSKGIVDGLQKDKFDIGMIGMKFDNDDLEYIPFCEDHMVLITPVNEHFFSYYNQEQVPLDALLKEPIILRENGSGSKKCADSFLESMGLTENQLQVVAHMNDQEAIKNMVASGMGVSIISEKAAKNFKEEKRVLVFNLPDSTTTRTLYIVYRKNYILNPHVKEFIHFLEKYYHE